MQNSYILIEQTTKKYNTIEELRFILKKRDNFWNLSLCTLYLDGLNQLKSFAVVIFSTVSINTSTVVSWRPQ